MAVMSNNKTNKEINKRKKKAESIINDEEKSNKFLSKADNKIKKEKIKGAFTSLPKMLDMVKSYIKGEYKELPVGTVVAVVAALLYWVSPIDVIPDFIPFVGYIDDGAVILFCAQGVQYDLNTYIEWAKTQTQISKKDGSQTEL